MTLIGKHGPAMIAGAALAAALGASAPPAAAEVNLIFATATPPIDSTNAKVFKPWVDQLNAAGKGVVHIDYRPGTSLADFGNILDRVLNNVVQIGYALHSVYSHQFRGTSVSFLPYITPDSEAGAVALWRLYKSGMLNADYKEAIPLALNVQAQARLHFYEAPKSFMDLAGNKIAAPGKLYSEIVERMGGTPITLTLPEMYQGLSRHTVDGILMGWGGVGAFKLYDVSHYHVEVPLGASSSMIFMARKTYDSLPAAARKVIDSLSGEALSKRFGAFTDEQTADWRERIGAMKDQAVAVPTKAQSAELEKKLAPLVREWEKQTPNGPALLAAYRDLLGKVQDHK
jgi:TRAP-type transport system periplasmic protein